MRYFGAYLLAVLGGNPNPDVSVMKKILDACNISYSEERITELLEKMKDKDPNELVAQGLPQLGDDSLKLDGVLSFTSVPVIPVNIKDMNANDVINAAAYLLAFYSGKTTPDEKTIHTTQRSVGKGVASDTSSSFAAILKDKNIHQLVAIGRAKLVEEERKPPPKEPEADRDHSRSYSPSPFTYDEDDTDMGGLSLFD